MSQILVQVDATGVVSDELRNELAGVLAGQDEFGVTVLLIEHDMRRLTKDIAVAGGYQ